MIEKLRRLADGGEEVTLKLKHRSTENGERLEVRAVSDDGGDPVALALTWEGEFPFGTLKVEPLDEATDTVENPDQPPAE